MKMTNRVILFIMDSVGVGALPDAEKFGDKGVNTLGHIAEQYKEFNIPNLRQLGVGNIAGLEAIEPVENPIGSYGKADEVSNGKDTTTGHWELVGLNTQEPFNTYPDGFPPEVIDEFEKQVGRKILCNKPASGTVILEELGEEHMKTGMPIVYTSADSVFQIAAHEDVISLEELYKMCSIAREILRGEHQVARVIARPFKGEVGNFARTPNRRDYSVDPSGKMLLDDLKEDGQDVIAVGKIVDIFNGVGITEDVHTKSNMDGVDQTIKYLKEQNKGLIFTNLVDFDAMFGHRRNVIGYGQAIEELDARIPEMLDAMNDDDIIIFTADHGNDPSYKGTDHTREYVPIIVYGKNLKQGVNLGIRNSFADIGATIAEILKVKYSGMGESFYSEVKL